MDQRDSGGRAHRARGARAVWWTLAVLLAAPAASAQQAACPEGQATSADTAGHCCWPAQVWSVVRGVCVGTPQCPAGFVVDGEACVRAPVASATAPTDALPGAVTTAPAPACEGGRTLVDDLGHCCWPAQTWHAGAGVCVGAPSCPEGLLAQAGECIAVAQPAAATPAPVQPAATEPPPAPPPPPPPPISPAVEPPREPAPDALGPRVFVAPPRSPRALSPVGPVLGALGVALMAASIPVWVSGDASYRRLRAACEAGSCPRDAAAVRGAVQAADVATSVLLVSGAVLAATGVVVTIATWPRADRAAGARPVASVAVRPGLASLFVAAQF